MAPGPPAEALARCRGFPPTVVPAGLVIETPESTHEISVPPNRVALVIATGAGAGYAPVAPGTFGSALGLVLYPVLAGLGPWLYALTLLALLSVGIWAADEAERVFRCKDDGRIVIDEVVGQLLTLAPLMALSPPMARRAPPARTYWLPPTRATSPASSNSRMRWRKARYPAVGTPRSWASSASLRGRYRGAPR